jgi:hypothetical protein
MNSLGVDVMITIFLRFLTIAAKKMAFFFKTNVIIQILEKKIAVFWTKNPILGENIFKIITSAPDFSKPKYILT